MFQSPRNRVNTSKIIILAVGAGIGSACRCFNPLEIGSTLQKQVLSVGHPHRGRRGFNPLEIGSTLQKPIQRLIVREIVGSFNPLEIGSTLQKRELRLRAMNIQAAFQSPRNRVNTSKLYNDRPRATHSTRFQSPRNRVNTSKYEAAYEPTPEGDEGFNPLEIGSTLQNRSWISLEEVPR